MKTDQRGAVLDRGPEPPQAQRAQWEYRSGVMELGADLSQYGVEGWELVSVTPVPHDPGSAAYHFKRKR